MPSLQDVPFVSVFVWQTPDASQVSGLSHAVSDELPHAVPPGAGVPLVQAPVWQVSLTVHVFPSLHDVPLVRLEWTHESLPAKGSGVVAHVVTPVSVPVMLPMESTAVLPLPALNDHRCTRPVADSSSVLMVD